MMEIVILALAFGLPIVLLGLLLYGGLGVLGWVFAIVDDIAHRGMDRLEERWPVLRDGNSRPEDRPKKSRLP